MPGHAPSGAKGRKRPRAWPESRAVEGGPGQGLKAGIAWLEAGVMRGHLGCLTPTAAVAVELGRGPVSSGNRSSV